MSLDVARPHLVSNRWDAEVGEWPQEQTEGDNRLSPRAAYAAWRAGQMSLTEAVSAAQIDDCAHYEAIARRTLDIVLSIVGLVLLSPLLLLVALAVRLDSAGPAIFRQQRVGRNGRLFTFYKFRGMYVDARERWPMLYAYSYNQGEVHELRFHPDRDPRVTRVGRFIRKTSIDEVLNLFNVLKGDMSLVGPRPEIPEMVPYYGDLASYVLAIKPGVTSLAKASGRDEHTFGETLLLDVEYLLRRSLWLDLKILVGTLGMVLLQRGVKAG